MMLAGAGLLIWAQRARVDDREEPSDEDPGLLPDGDEAPVPENATDPTPDGDAEADRSSAEPREGSSELPDQR